MKFGEFEISSFGFVLVVVGTVGIVLETINLVAYSRRLRAQEKLAGIVAGLDEEEQERRDLWVAETQARCDKINVEANGHI